jgi:catechol 2,3-dioxygenase
VIGIHIPEFGMGARLHDLFGDASRIERVTPESYGVHPPAYRLPDATHIRGVTLQVSNLTRSRAFYEQTLGFAVLSSAATSVTFGTHGSTAPLVTLLQSPDATPAAVNKRLGLFHFAILLPSRGDLGRFLAHLQQRGERAGAGDHLVSEALYLQDPDDLGIEVYADRSRDVWQRRGRELVMGTDSLDMQSLLEAGGSTAWTGMPLGTTIGHVHLHVGDIETANRFYADAVGFDRMVWSYPGALFLAAGGYHHHLGTNIWAGAGAVAATSHEPQLLEWTLALPTAADVAAASASVTAAGFPVEPAHDDGSVLVRDPWGTPLRMIRNV